jgi:hypothetical protein
MAFSVDQRAKRDRPFEILEIEIAHWRKNPTAVFRLMQKNSICGQIEYVLGGIADP